jgi:hypothetical protein
VVHVVRCKAAELTKQQCCSALTLTAHCFNVVELSVDGIVRRAGMRKRSPAAAQTLACSDCVASCASASRTEPRPAAAAAGSQASTQTFSQEVAFDYELKQLLCDEFCAGATELALA